MHPAVKFIEEQQLKKDIPAFRVGDTLQMSLKVQEGDRTRTQLFEGIVIARKGTGLRQSFTVRRVSFGEGIERTFPLHSPSIQKIVVSRRGKVRRAKLYYLRQQSLKRSRIAEEKERGESTAPSA